MRVVNYDLRLFLNRYSAQNHACICLSGRYISCAGVEVVLRNLYELTHTAGVAGERWLGHSTDAVPRCRCDPIGAPAKRASPPFDKTAIHCVPAGLRISDASGEQRQLHWCGANLMGFRAFGRLFTRIVHKRPPFGSKKRRCTRKTCRSRYTMSDSVSARVRPKPGSDYAIWRMLVKRALRRVRKVEVIA